MSHAGLPVGWLGGSDMLTRLIDEALVERRRRLHETLPGADVHDADVVRRRRAACLVERMLSSGSPPRVDCSRFIGTLASRLQMASSVIDRMMTSIVPLVMPSRRGRALAVMIAEVIAFVEASAVSEGPLEVYLALGLDGEDLVVGIGAEGAMEPVGTARATRGLLRAGAVACLMGGRLDRGVDGGRMVVGITLPASISTGSTF